MAQQGAAILSAPHAYVTERPAPLRRPLHTAAQTWYASSDPVGKPGRFTVTAWRQQLTSRGVALVEVASGVDIEREILARMDFKPLIPRDPALMDRRIFADGPMGLRDDLLRIPLDRRFTYHPKENLFFVNLEGHVVRSREDVERLRRTVETILTPLGRKVYVIVNYDNFEIFPDVIDDYSAMVRDLVDRFYSGVTRYTTSGFLRAKLGDALNQRAVAPHIYESAEEASAHLRALEAQTAG